MRKLLLMLVLVYAASSCNANVVTFDDLERPGTGVQQINAGYISAVGDLFGNLRFAYQENPLYHSSASMWGEVGTEAMLFCGSCAVTSIDLASLYHWDDPTKTFTVSFKGIRENGQEIWQNFTVAGDFKTFTFDYRFSRIVALRWYQSSDVNHSFQFDNIVGEPVGELPEPLSIALMGIGVAGLAAARRKRPA